MTISLKNHVSVFFNHLFNRKYQANCGHKTYLKDKVSAFGKNGILIIYPEDGEIEYCHRCLEKMTVQCAQCGDAIFVGSGYSLAEAKEFTEEEKIPEHAHKTKIIHEGKEKEVYLSCLGIKCTSNFDARYGILLPNQKIENCPPLF